MTTDAPRIISRRSITSNWQVPTCERFVWTTPPDPETGTGGTGFACKVRAAHRIRLDYTPWGTRESWEICVCRAHLGEELDDIARGRAWTLRYERTELADPVVTTLEYSLDVRAYAHGKRRFWLTESETPPAPIELELFGTTPALRAPARSRSRPAQPSAATPPIQPALFDPEAHQPGTGGRRE
ncbi:hypothetical protein [Nocardia terpenica]|uniref:Uncharacterized protein n=1 Tax=Nocardia terpenica TaxID=455432 RepID=A0A291RYU9_9NOCA|nr:hypothetical protein [Nocardia terpenica]ATL72505.1 hypothetical protein CRH09_39725 [Nocardia terpenica]